MNLPRLSIWQQWLLHTLLIWVVIEANDALTYWYEVYTHGAYLINSDGSSVTQWQRFVNHNYHQAIGLVLLVGLLPIELNYHLTFRRRPFLSFLLSAVVCSLIFSASLNYFNRWRFGGQPAPIWEPTLVLVGYTVGYALLRDYIYRRANRSQQLLQQSRAELAALKAQINPHFFFNALNTIYGTALLEQADQTAQSIEELASIMRYTLTESQEDWTAVANEFTFLTHYLHLQEVRLPQRATIQIRSQLYYDEQPAQIAPLLLIPFVENAFKYGIRIDQPCFVDLQLTVRQQQLNLRISNSTFAGQDKLEGPGTGLENTRRRLQLLYPDNYQLSCQQEAHQYCVHLQINLHR